MRSDFEPQLREAGLKFIPAAMNWEKTDFKNNCFIIVGESNQERLLIVSYTERGDLIRLISAREVTRAEREAYEEG